MVDVFQILRKEFLNYVKPNHCLVSYLDLNNYTIQTNALQLDLIPTFVIIIGIIPPPYHHYSLYNSPYSMKPKACYRSLQTSRHLHATKSPNPIMFPLFPLLTPPTPTIEPTKKQPTNTNLTPKPHLSKKTSTTLVN